MARYEIDHQGHIVESKTELCKDKDGMIISLFSQFGWSVEKVNKEGPYMQLKLSKNDFEDVFVNVFSGNVRNEDRNSYEKKIQLNGKDPIPLKNENTIVTSLISKEDVQATELNEMVEKTFEGSLPAFIAAFTKHTKISDTDIDALQQMIDNYRKGE